jgi:plasmid stabilization system protein ParE
MEKKAKVEWPIPTLERVRKLEEYIARDSVFVAGEVVDALFTTAERLAFFPNLGRKLTYERKDYRRVLVKGYLLIYEVKKDVVTIRAVVRAVRNLKKALKEEGL